MSLSDYDLNQIAKKQEIQADLVQTQDQFNLVEVLLTVTIHHENDTIRSGGVLFELQGHLIIESWLGNKKKCFHPYIPTYLSLRNKQPLKEAINHFWGKFDILLVEGAGQQHPRFYGLASELGTEFQIPTIGVTKKSLVGEVDFNDGQMINSFPYEIFPVFIGERKIAAFIRKLGNIKGIYISIGHMISLESSMRIILPLLQNKLPEPLKMLKKLLKS